MYDVIIIGSGPAGLSAAVYASRAQLKYAVVEKEYMGTGQIALTERVDNYLGYHGIDGFSLGEKFREHAESLGTEFIENEVTDLSRRNGAWHITYADGGQTDAKAVVYAAGAFPRKLGISGEAELTGRGVSYCALCDGAFFSGKTVAVIGGGDTALEDALYLANIAEKVYLIHRRSEFRANKTLQEQVAARSNIEPVLGAVPVEITGSEKTEGVRVAQNGTERELCVSGVFIAVGTIPNTAILRGKVELDEIGCIMAGEDCISSAEGLFAAGDVRTKELRQVITAAADGANAVASASRYLQTEK